VGGRRHEVGGGRCCSGCRGVAEVAGSIHINSTVPLSLLFCFPFFSFIFPFLFISLFVGPQICIFSCFVFHISYFPVFMFQNESGMNSVDSLRTTFHRTAGCINRVIDFFR
jgi:hypothetical protein